MPVDLGHRVRAARVEGGGFVLGRLPRLAVHLRARGLVEADLGVDEPQRVEHPRHPDRRELARQRRLDPAGRNEGLSRQVVDLGRLDLADRGHQRALIQEIGLVQMHAVAQVIDPLEGLGARAAHHAVHLVALLEQQLGQIGAVLAGDAGDEGNAGSHDSFSFPPEGRSGRTGSSRAPNERTPRFQSSRSVRKSTAARQSAAT